MALWPSAYTLRTRINSESAYEIKIYIADDLPGGEESMIETVAHEWKRWLQYCNDEAYDEEEAEDFAGQIVEEFL